MTLKKKKGKCPLFRCYALRSMQLVNAEEAGVSWIFDGPTRTFSLLPYLLIDDRDKIMKVWKKITMTYILIESLVDGAIGVQKALLSYHSASCKGSRVFAASH